MAIPIHVTVSFQNDEVSKIAQAVELLATAVGSGIKITISLDGAAEKAMTQIAASMASLATATVPQEPAPASRTGGAGGKGSP